MDRVLAVAINVVVWMVVIATLCYRKWQTKTQTHQATGLKNLLYLLIYNR